MEISFASNGTYAGTQSGKYVFDQTAKTITMTPEGSATSNTFNVGNPDRQQADAPWARRAGPKLMLKTK
ncbi:MAG: hypothetical protein WKG07_45510 [Hymenobacter sp.]